MADIKPHIHVSFDLLPEGRDWIIGKNYRVKLLLRQVATSEEGADFEIVDATSLESVDRGKRQFVTDGGTLKG